MEEVFKVYKITHPERKNPTVWEVSNMGRIRVNGVIKEPVAYKNGYYYVGNKLLHRVVAELFIPNPENKPEVDHINTVLSDNRAVNLRWCTRSENCSNPLTKQHKISSLQEYYAVPENMQAHKDRMKTRKRTKRGHYSDIAHEHMRIAARERERKKRLMKKEV